MNLEKINRIADGKYGHELLQLMFPITHNTDYPEKLRKIVGKVAKFDLFESENKKIEELFLAEEIAFILEEEPSQFFDNVELICRWKDLAVVFSSGRLRDNIEFIWSSYISVFNATLDYHYLARALHYAKRTKSFFMADRKELLAIVSPIILTEKPAFYQEKLLIEMCSLIGAVECRERFGGFVQASMDSLVEKKDFSSARKTAEIQRFLGVLNENQLKIRTGELFEQEGDHFVSEKQPNTYYPNISRTYLEALRSIDSVKGISKLKKRLDEKIAAEQLLDYKMVSHGVRLSVPVPIEQIQQSILSTGVDSFESAYVGMMGLPFIPITVIDKYVGEIEGREGALSKFFGGKTRLSTKGAEVAHQSSEDGYRSDGRNHYRERTIAFIHCYKNLMDYFGGLSDATIDALLVRAKSPFVPKDRHYIYSMALMEGFANNFTACAHLLMPQIENSFREMGEVHGINMTKYENKVQHQSMFGGCLEKLAPIMEPDAYEEIMSFLVDGNSVNFRNELLHGLISPVLIEHYGKYLWWISLKLIFQTDSIFIGNTG